MTRMLVALGAFALSACGTVMHGSRDTIFVDSKPDGAAASISCAGNVEARGTTPAKLVIPRKVQGCSVSVERAGYKTQRLDLDQSFSGAFWANFAFSPVLATATIINGRDFGYDTAAALLSSGVAFLIDQYTGAKYTYEPKEIVVDLEPID
jgi:hypothetical protein